MRKRESGIDLYRCLGLLFVTGLHSFLYNGFYSEAQGLSMLFPNMARWLFSACNGMFMLMTGYLKTKKPWDRGYYRGLWTVLVGYGLTCLISYPIRHFLYGEEHTLLQWIDRFFTFDGYGWYIGMYVGLILLSPVLNLAMDHMDRRQLLGLALTMAALTALPSATPIHLLPEYWTGLYPLTYYTLGAVIRRLELHIPSRVGLLGAAMTAGLMGLLSSLTAAGGVFTDGFVQGGNGGFLSTILVTMLLSRHLPSAAPPRPGAAPGLAQRRRVRGLPAVPTPGCVGLRFAPPVAYAGTLSPALYLRHDPRFPLLHPGR